MVSLDRKVFEEGSQTRTRMASYGAIFNELHIIVYTKHGSGCSKHTIAPNVWVYPTNSRSKLLYIWNAIHIGRAILKKTDIAVVSAQDSSDTGIAATRIAKACSAALHLQDHADVFNEAYQQESSMNRVRAMIAKRLLPRASLVRTVSSTSEQHLLNALPVLQGRTYLLPVYSDIKAVSNNSTPFSLKETYPVAQKIILCACRLVPQKNLSLAIEVFARVKETHPSAVLLIVGEGPELDYLKQQTRQNGVEQAVLFESWQEDLSPYYKSADLFLMTSHYESYGRTLVEAAVYGVPFVSTDVGIASDLAREGVGIVSTSAQPQDLALLALDALANSDSLETRIERGRGAARLLQGTSHQEYLERYKDMMERCLTSYTASQL